MTTWNRKSEIASIFWNNLRDSFDIPIGFGNWLKPLVDLCYILYVYDERGDGAGLVSHRSNSDHNRSKNIKYFNLIYFFPVITEVIYCFQYRIWLSNYQKFIFFVEHQTFNKIALQYLKNESNQVTTKMSLYCLKL